MRCLLALICIASCAFADDALKLPAEVKGSKGQPIYVKADTTLKKVAWKSLDPGLAVVDRKRLLDQTEAIVFSCTPGRYRLACWYATPDGDVSEQVECVVVVEDAPPTPPIPPRPDALIAALRELFAQDPSPEKAKQVRALAAVWRGAIDYCNDPELTTAGQLLAIIREASNKVLPGDSLKAIRLRVAEELRATMPLDSDAALTADSRRVAATAFARIALALESLK